jgi:uncharacterized membrane protein
MLLSSILQILGQFHDQVQPKVAEKANVEKFEIEPAPAAEEASGLQNIEREIASAAGPLKPPLEPSSAEKPLAGQNLEELIRAVTKFEKPEESRVVDVFE